MNISKYSGVKCNWDLNDDGRRGTMKTTDPVLRRYWRKQMLKKIYGLRCKVKLEDEINVEIEK